MATPVVGIVTSSIKLGKIHSLTELAGMVMIIMALLVNAVSVIRPQIEQFPGENA